MSVFFIRVSWEAFFETEETLIAQQFVADNKFELFADRANQFEFFDFLKTKQSLLP